MHLVGNGAEWQARHSRHLDGLFEGLQPVAHARKLPHLPTRATGQPVSHLTERAEH